MSMAQYIQELKDMLKHKNCVIIASPDVNPLTEIVLGQVYGIPQDKWFDGNYRAEDQKNNAVVSFKEFEPNENNHSDLESKDQIVLDKNKVPNKRSNSQTFYREEPLAHKLPEGEKLKRGFITRYLEDLAENQRVVGYFVSQVKETKDDFTVHAHLVVVPNPFEPEPGVRNFIVLLNGVSGPATFALTHVLTGPKDSKFASYPSAPGHNFDPSAESEMIVQLLLNTLIGSGGSTDNNDKNRTGIQCIIEVEVGEASGQGRSPFDWRHIKGWSLYKKNPRTIKPFLITLDEAKEPAKNPRHSGS
jgi:hypothetical protein